MRKYSHFVKLFKHLTKEGYFILLLLIAFAIIIVRWACFL